jgi:hypothetical protein
MTLVGKDRHDYWLASLLVRGSPPHNFTLDSHEKRR